MASAYARWIHGWETRLAGRDPDRRERPFEWGWEWLGLEPQSDPARVVAAWSAERMDRSDAFFGFQAPSDYRLREGCLNFTSPIDTPYPANNLVCADFLPARRETGGAMVILPQWNADAASHIGLCRLLNRFGVTALRMSLAYHDRRMPPELTRADYHVSSNIGRTIQACRQSVVDARACLTWLQQRGYARLGILGTSLGSCIAFIAAAHDTRVRAAVYNHASMQFGDVVWTGLSTRHVRRGIEGSLTQDELRACWAAISPASYLDRMIGRDVRSLIVWARYDTTFLPCFSQQIIGGFRSRGLPLEVRTLPCGHYTTGELPFKLIDGYAMCRFVAKNL